MINKLSTVCLLLAASHAFGQTFTTLHNFNTSDGSIPEGPLAISGNVLYGETESGGSANGFGTTFKVNTDGTGFSTQYIMTGTADGAYPSGGLLLSGSTLYGVSQRGGQQFTGSIFSGNTGGSGYTAVYSFVQTNGIYPIGTPILSGGYFYGTTLEGSSNNSGTIFKIGSGGGGFTVLHNFSVLTNGTNLDGGTSYAGLALAGSTLYGVGTFGGTNGFGTIFKINTDGSSFTVLRTLDYDNDGSRPVGGLIVTNGSIYGTAEGGGAYTNGTIFKMSTNGTGFTVLHNFDLTFGSFPQSTLTLSTNNNVLYGTTIGGGGAGNGVIFAINIDGTGFTNFHSFSAFTSSTTNNADGASPIGAMILVGTNLYGTAAGGGTNGQGTVFKVSVPSAHPAFFNGEVALNNGVYYLQFPNNNLFGYYTYAFFPYLYHYDLGFEYYIDANDANHGAYLYDFTSGHFWYTSPNYSFPYVYDFSLNAVLYYYPNTTNAGHYTTNPRYFYNTVTSNIFTQ